MKLKHWIIVTVSSFYLIGILATSFSYETGIHEKTAVQKKSPIIKLTKKSILQGDTLFIEITAEKELHNPSAIFENKSFKLFKIDDYKYKGMMGVEAIKKTGNYKLSFTDTSGELNQTVDIKVINARYPVQNITISGSKSTLSASQYELDKIGKEKEKLFPIKYMESAPYTSPAKGCISSIYGVSRYHNGKMTGDYHKGVDIRANHGQPIRAITGGEVVIAEPFKLHGGTVMINHGQGLSSIYIHMSKINVQEGDIVKHGQQIGLVGSTGFATGPHLHWGLYIHGIPVDPMKYWIKPVSACL